MPNSKQNTTIPSIDEEIIARAEAALKQVSEELSGWIDQEVDALIKLHASLSAEAPTLERINELHHKAHDIKGIGSTLNFPLATTIAASLCHLCEHLPTPTQLPASLVEAHVNALNTIVHDNIQASDHPATSALAQALESEVAQMVQQWACS